MAVDRKSALCNQTALTGIDFIQVVEPFVQTVLRVFFAVEPSALTPVPMVNPASLTPPAPNQDAGPLLATTLGVTIVSTETGRAVPIASRGWRLAGARAARHPARARNHGRRARRLRDPSTEHRRRARRSVLQRPRVQLQARLP